MRERECVYVCVSATAAALRGLIVLNAFGNVIVVDYNYLTTRAKSRRRVRRSYEYRWVLGSAGRFEPPCCHQTSTPHL